MLMMDKVHTLDDTDSNTSSKSNKSSVKLSEIDSNGEIEVNCVPEGRSETKSPSSIVIMKEEAMDFSPSELSKPVDLSNNNNVNNNNNSTTTNNNNNSLVVAVGGGSNNNNNNNNNGVTRGKCGGGGSLGARTESTTASCNGSGRTLAFSVENILDPNKFTGKTSGLHPTPTSLLSTSDFVSTHHQHHHHHHQPSAHFRFPFKDIHGMDVSFHFLSFSQILCPSSTIQRVPDRVSIKAHEKNVLILRVRERFVLSLDI
jgi:hypothetical protein